MNFNDARADLTEIVRGTRLGATTAEAEKGEGTVERSDNGASSEHSRVIYSSPFARRSF